jgi:flagellar biogenesis protein FliO
VFLGTEFTPDAANRSTSSKVIDNCVVLLSLLVTVFAAIYIYRKMSKVRPLVMEEKL